MSFNFELSLPTCCRSICSTDSSETNKSQTVGAIPWQFGLHT